MNLFRPVDLPEMSGSDCKMKMSNGASYGLRVCEIPLAQKLQTLAAGYTFGEEEFGPPAEIFIRGRSM